MNGPLGAAFLKEMSNNLRLLLRGDLTDQKGVCFSLLGSGRACSEGAVVAGRISFVKNGLETNQQKYSYKKYRDEILTTMIFLLRARLTEVSDNQICFTPILV